jgi:hypothetical protein
MGQIRPNEAEPTLMESVRYDRVDYRAVHYESAALTAELRALREATLDFIMIWNNCEAAISNDGTP